MGLGNKDEEFWKFVSKCDFISLSETWVEEKSWERSKWLPDSHEWMGSMARKVKKGENDRRDINKKKN